MSAPYSFRTRGFIQGHADDARPDSGAFNEVNNCSLCSQDCRPDLSYSFLNSGVFACRMSFLWMKKVVVDWQVTPMGGQWGLNLLFLVTPEPLSSLASFHVVFVVFVADSRMRAASNLSGLARSAAQSGPGSKSSSRSSKQSSKQPAGQLAANAEKNLTDANLHTDLSKALDSCTCRMTAGKCCAGQFAPNDILTVRR